MEKNFCIDLAGHSVELRPRYGELFPLCAGYLTRKAPEFSVSVSPEELIRERVMATESALREGRRAEFTEGYLETLAVYRRICEKLIGEDILLLHGSAVALDGECYLFTAPSGTGKSTHTRLWRRQFGDRAFMVNDDKPLMHITPRGVWICGTPWDGKHRLSRNVQLPLKALCFLERAEENRICSITASEALPGLLQQCYWSPREETMEKILSLLDCLMGQAAFYRLGCNQAPEAALVAYEGMRGTKQ